MRQHTLSGSIPNLQLDGLSLELDGANLEVDTDGRDVRLSVGVIGKAEEKARLADARVTNKQKLEEIVAERQINRGLGVRHESGVLFRIHHSGAFC